MELKTRQEVSDFVLYKKENNLDQVDNLHELPELPAVYAISGRINGVPANCRYIGITQNLCESIKKHFSDSETHVCLRQFMQSIKIKTLNYEVTLDFSSEELTKKKEEWEKRFKPECNDKLNEVF